METIKLNGHLSENNDFLGWRKTSISLIKAKGKDLEGRKYLKKKPLLKKLWTEYKKSNQFKELPSDKQNQDYKSIEEVVSKILSKETKKFDIVGDDIKT